MKLLLVAVQDSQELPIIEGTLIAVTQHTSSSPTPAEITQKVNELAGAASWQLCRAVENPSVVR